MPAPRRGTSPDKIRARVIRWPGLALTALFVGGAAGCAQAVSPSPVAETASAVTSISSAAPKIVATGHAPATHSPSPTASPSASPSATSSPANSSTISAAPANGSLSDHRGSLILNETGAQLQSWNQTSSYCPSNTDLIGDGTADTDSSGDLILKTSGKPGSCAALISPGAYQSDVIEAKLYFPSLPGKPGTIANWTSFWLTDAAKWPANGELDGVEVEPVDATNAVTWHSGTAGAQFTASTSRFSSLRLPTDSPNLTPGWHTVDIVYTKGYFAVYYDFTEFTSFTSSKVTGDPLNLYFTIVNTPATSSIEKQIGSPPINSDTTPTTYTLKSLKIWTFR
jgi:hypothetical protein